MPVERPHHLAPVKYTARVILAVKNFAAVRGVCHIGLGITALNTMRTLRKLGYFVEVWAAQTPAELEAKIDADIKKGGPIPISDVVVSAPSWVQPDDFQHFGFKYPDIDFIQLNHSGCAYLSIDKFGIRNIRQMIDLELSTHNLKIAGNNPRFVNWVKKAFQAPCLHLPNLYDCDTFVNPRPPFKPIGHVLRVGSFGASRPWKNQLVAAEAAVQLARQMGVELEFYVNSKRPDGGERMIESREELFNYLRGCRLIEVPWERWPKFRHTVSTMNIMFSPSFDETFCVVVADGIAVGTPSVVTPAIEWAPHEWMCEPESPDSIVKVAHYLLNDCHAVEDGRDNLTRYTRYGIEEWKKYMGL